VHYLLLVFFYVLRLVESVLFVWNGQVCHQASLTVHLLHSCLYYAALTIDIKLHQNMLSQHIVPTNATNRWIAGALPWTSLGELTVLPDPIAGEEGYSPPKGMLTLSRTPPSLSPSALNLQLFRPQPRPPDVGPCLRHCYFLCVAISAICIFCATVYVCGLLQRL